MSGSTNSHHLEELERIARRQDALASILKQLAEQALEVTTEMQENSRNRLEILESMTLHAVADESKNRRTG